MFLKTLTLKGFKSFAEATTIELEPGVTVVVGPNGSGKSNVVDAVAWVLGAQGPKVVRSQKMEDVIFAGTGKRAALGRAEVSLTIDNSSKILPVDLSEVTITRTLFRSGDSEYALNGVECRLLDIQELLSDSGVGRTQHVIVSQGQLDWVLNARPEERRMIIEEAAGVLKYRKRREKAERRLEATHGDLQRLTDLLSEVKRSIRPLERQADAARRHGALAEELAGLRLYLAGRDLAALAKAGEQATLQRTELGESDERLVSQLRIFDEQVSGLESRLDVLRQEDLTAVVGQVSAIRERAMGLARVIEERKRSNQMEQQATIARSETARRLEREATELQGEVESSRSDSVISSNAKQTALELVEKAEQAMTAAESEFRIAEADHQRWAARSEALAQAMSQARARAGAERLSGIGGVLGALAEVVDVDEGWELAFEAAVGEVAAAVVVDGAITARESLERFASSEEGGAVLPADIGGNVRSVNVDLSDLPSGCEAIRVHVRASNTLSSRAQMDRVLDGLLASAVVVAGDWTDAMDLASKRGDLVVVTREGDRFAESGWRVGTGGTGASRAALDLARLNESKAASEANRAQNTLSGIRSEYSRARQEYEIKAHEQARNDERLRLLTERLHSLESGLAPIEEPIIEDQKTESQVVGMSADVEAMNRLKAVVAECVSLTEAKLADLASQRDSQTRQLNEAVSKLESARKSRVEAERSLSQVRERQQRIEIELAENRMRTEAAVENLRRDLDSEPEQARIAECPELPPGVTARQRERE
ncbi:MAG TPA: AAA family ATPase, partial [Acidimicrobiales bacterium]|nr:AAA family ATPase [Acidimicrobiales bacterium]